MQNIVNLIISEQTQYSDEQMSKITSRPRNSSYWYHQAMVFKAAHSPDSVKCISTFLSAKEPDMKTVDKLFYDFIVLD